MVVLRIYISIEREREGDYIVFSLSSQLKGQSFPHERIKREDKTHFKPSQRKKKENPNSKCLAKPSSQTLKQEANKASYLRGSESQGKTKHNKLGPAPSMS